MNQKLRNSKGFYQRLFAIAIPIILQNGISNFVSLLDNLMVGQLGTLEMSGVSIVNQLMTVFYICVFGAASGAGVFTAQYYGSGNQEGIRHALRFKMIACLGLTVAGIALCLNCRDALIGAFLQGEGEAAHAAQALEFGGEYLKIMLWGMVPFALTTAYAGTMRECGKAVPPMVASICAVFINLILNYILIFGHFGAPAMGVKGAAIATVISRYAELAIVALWCHLHADENPYIRGVYRSFHIPGKLFSGISIKSAPLLVNELLWSTGMTFLNQCYSTCGLDVVPALNISSTLGNLASVVCLAIGNSTGIVLGQMLGGDRSKEDILSASKKSLLAGVLSGVSFGLLMIAISGVFPRLYNTTEDVRQLATKLVLLTALIWLPMRSFLNPIYFTMRAGGKTLITLLYDSGFLWLVEVPFAFIMSRYTGISILWLFALCNGLEIIKCIIGLFMLRSGTWMQRLLEK